jgi:hypothetical protein
VVGENSSVCESKGPDTRPLHYTKTAHFWKTANTCGKLDSKKLQFGIKSDLQQNCLKRRLSVYSKKGFYSSEND